MSSFINQVFGFIPSKSPQITNLTYTVPNGMFSLVTVYFMLGNSTSSVQTISLNGTVVLQQGNAIGGSSSEFSSLAYFVDSGATAFAGTPFELGSGKAGVLENGNGGTTPSLTYYHNMQVPTRLTFFAKTGDVISGSGNFRILYNEYINSNSTISGFKYFNYCPAQNIVASSAYTVPAGKYAKVLAYFLMQSYAPSSISNYPSVSVITINGSIVNHINNRTSFEYYKYFNSKANADVIIDNIQKNKSFFSPKANEYELKAGDVISGSGTWRAIISLYDIPT